LGDKYWRLGEAAMDELMAFGGIVAFFGVFVWLYVSLQRAQRENNRNSNPDQSSYVDSPPNGGG